MGSGNAPLAIVLLAHTAPQQVRRLVEVLAPSLVMLHCDIKAGSSVASEMVQGLEDRVVPVPARDARLASWSLVEAELAGLRSALNNTTSPHIAVVSGSDYPLMSMNSMYDTLSAWRGRSWYWNQQVPWEPWGVPGFRDGGLWRFRYRFLTVNDHARHLFGKPVFWPLRRPIPADLALRASNHWKIYAREDAKEVLRFVDERPDLVAFARTMYTPEESFIPGLLGSSVLRGDKAVAVTSVDPWLIKWPDTPSTHPSWLTMEDFDLIRTRSVATMATPRLVDAAASDSLTETAPLFGRKFRDEDLLDRIDSELRK